MNEFHEERTQNGRSWGWCELPSDSCPSPIPTPEWEEMLPVCDLLFPDTISSYLVSSWLLGRLQLLTIYCETSNVVGVGKIHSEKANKEAYMICWKANTSNFMSITWKYMSKRLHFSIIFLVHKYLQSTFYISSAFLVAWEMLVINKSEWLPLGNVSGG